MSEGIHITSIQNPLVSICIPVYNADKTLEKTLCSIVNQSYKNLEIIVVDNLSTDDTQKIVEKFPDSRIRFIQNGVHFDAGEDNWNTCFQHAKGEYIAIFHADDIYLPTIIEKQLSCFLQYPDIGAVFTSANIIDGNGKIFGESRLPSIFNEKQVVNFEEIFPLILENYNFFICPSAIVKGELYKELSPFRYEKFLSSSDLDMWLRILERGPVAILNDKLICYRVTENSGTFKLNNMRTEKADFFRVIEYYLEKYPELEFSSNTVTQYRYYELGDTVGRATNYIAMNRLDESYVLLKELLTPKYLKPLLLQIFNFKYKRAWMWGVKYLIILKIYPKMLVRCK
jgi:glycosyltransferase involved in cell wall biosynthesis